MSILNQEDTAKILDSFKDNIDKTVTEFENGMIWAINASLDKNEDILNKFEEDKIEDILKELKPNFIEILQERVKKLQTPEEEGIDNA